VREKERREREKWKDKKKSEKARDEDRKRRHLEQYVEQPGEWGIERLKDRKTKEMNMCHNLR